MCQKFGEKTEAESSEQEAVSRKQEAVSSGERAKKSCPKRAAQFVPSPIDYSLIHLFTY
jgi:hypothetical protein